MLNATMCATTRTICAILENYQTDKGIIVPANAVLINQEGKFVWVAKDGRATRRQISLSGYSGNGVIVNEGLETGAIKKRDSL